VSRARWKSVEFFCPLDVVRASYRVLGDVRDSGKRAHKGIDFVSTLGEPVRAIADGWLSMQAWTPGRGRKKGDARQVGHHSQKQHGPGGLFVQISTRTT